MANSSEYILPPSDALESKNADVAKDDGTKYQSGPFSGNGFACTNLSEPIPEFVKAECELVIKNSNNAYIVLGRDRPGNRFSGFGGQKFGYNAGMIDLVVGRGGSSPSNIDEKGEKLWVEPNFQTDAARIYISQTAKIDKYFGIAENLENTNSSLMSADNKSAIGIKADHVRIISRENVKIVTYQNNRNSKGQVLEKKGRISLIANNDDKALQPMVLGGSLRDCLKKITTEISALKDALNAFQKYQGEFNNAVSIHTHLSPYYGKQTSDSAALKQQEQQTKLDLFNFVASSCKAIEANIAAIEQEHLINVGTPQSIVSSYCFVN